MDLSSEQVAEIIIKYVGETKWNEMSEFERLRNTNMYRSYKECTDIGIPIPLPDFMVPTKTDDQLQERKHGSRRRNKTEHTQAREHPKRMLKTVNYAETETFIDGFIYCDNCEMEYEHFCPTCGMLTHIRDNKVKLAVKDRAKKSLPAGVLEIKTSPIHGNGVFSVKTLPKGLKFGPYEGITSVNSTSGYAWRLRGGKLLEAADETKSNWMRYINCARNVNEQNMVAFQYLGKMYYRTARRIAIGEELLVFYGNTFAKVLGIDTDNYFEPEIGEVEDENEFACNPCGFVFSEEKYLLYHKRYCKHEQKRIMELNKNRESFKCKYCQVEIIDQKFFDRHVKSCKWRTLRYDSGTRTEEEDDTGKKYKCKECKYQTDQKGNLVTHLRIHTDKRPFGCNKCGKGFRQKAHLERHKRIHSGEKNFKCNQCNKSFNGNSCLQRHIRLHSSVRPFKCSDCEMSFNRRDYLKCHRISRHQHGKKPHQCGQCEYSTVTLRNLKQHKMIHDNVKPFKCMKCDYRCIQSGTLKQHMRSHTGEKPYKCKLCEYSSAWSPALQYHMKNKHK